MSFANDDELIAQIESSVRTTLGRQKANMGGENLSKAVRNTLSNLLWRDTHTKPLIIPVVMEV